MLLLLLYNGRDVVSVVMGQRMSSKLHTLLIRKVMKAPINLFFDVTPLGHLISSFTTDLDRCDKDFYQHCE